MRAGEHWAVEDARSRNGTFVNGQRIAGRRLLSDGDAIRVGATVMLFRSPRLTPAPTLRASVGVTLDQLSESQRRVLVALCRPGPRGLAMTIAGFAAPAAFWYVRNLVLTGSPIFPTEIRLAGHTLFAGPGGPVSTLSTPR